MKQDNINLINGYTISLFALVEKRANISEFIELYLMTFGKNPTEYLMGEYQRKINPDTDDTESDTDSYCYEPSYSYSYD